MEPSRRDLTATGGRYRVGEGIVYARVVRPSLVDNPRPVLVRVRQLTVAVDLDVDLPRGQRLAQVWTRLELAGLGTGVAEAGVVGVGEMSH